MAAIMTLPAASGVGKLSASESVYHIGVPYDPLLTLETGSTLATYLNAEVGKLFDPPVSFNIKPLYFKDAMTLEEGLADGVLHFFFASAVQVVCVQERYQTHTIAQISRYDSFSIVFQNRGDFDAAELSGYGGLFVVRNDSDIQTIDDIRGRVVVSEPGLASPWDGLGGCLLQLGVLQARGLSYTDGTSAVIWNGGGPGQTVNLLVQKKADVAFLRTGVLELLTYLQDTTPPGHPLKPWLDSIASTRFRTVEGKMDETWDGGASGIFRRETCTPIVPEWSFNVVDGVDDSVKMAVLSAIMALRDGTFTDPISNVTSVAPWLNPVLHGSGYVYRFRTPLPTTRVRSLLQSLGLLRTDPVTLKRGCKTSDWSFEGIYDMITCPDGSFKKPLDQVKRGCQDEGFDCPLAFDGVIACTCHPCKEGDRIEVMMDVVESLSGPAVVVRNASVAAAGSNLTRGCTKMERCATVGYGSLLVLRVFDNSLPEKDTIITWAVRYTETKNVTGGTVKGLQYEYVANITMTEYGEHLLQVYMDGQEIPNSPFLVFVAPDNCTGGHEIFSLSERSCTCEPSYWRTKFDGVCRSVASISTVLVAIVVIGISILTTIYMKRSEYRALSSQWSACSLLLPCG